MKTLQAILEVRKAVGGVDKDGVNKFHKYKYATHNNVIHAVRDEMNDKGLIMYPTEVSDVSLSEKEKDGKKDGFVERWTHKFRLCTEEDPDGIEVAVRCAGEDKGDKTAYKGDTGAMKYALVETFLLPTDDDPENDGKQKPKPPRNESTPEWTPAQAKVLEGLVLVFGNDKPKYAKFLGSDKPDGVRLKDADDAQCAKWVAELNKLRDLMNTKGIN